NFFHAMRRQLDRPFRKPLINMAPKSLLRHPKCVSPKSDFHKGKRFQELIDDPNTVAAKNVKRVLLCSGKIYYDLLEKKESEQIKEVAIVRIEQLYPDRKSTRLNSSHVKISYAVFCLKKKKN